MQKLYES
jgi:hypothetical protein